MKIHLFFTSHWWVENKLQNTKFPELVLCQAQVDGCLIQLFSIFELHLWSRKETQPSLQIVLSSLLDSCGLACQVLLSVMVPSRIQNCQSHKPRSLLQFLEIQTLASLMERVQLFFFKITQRSPYLALGIRAGQQLNLLQIQKPKGCAFCTV